MKEIENRNILFALAAVLAVLTLSVFGLRILLDNISSLNDQLQGNKVLESTLQKKFNSLSSVSPEVTVDSQVAISALPVVSPVLPVMSNIRKQALSFGLTINNFSSGEIIDTANSEVLSGEIVFEIDGNYKNLTSLIDSIRNSSPVTTFDSMNITPQSALGGDNYKLTVHLIVYWASLPKTIPSVSSSFEGLTSDEQKIITQIASLNQPPISVSPNVSTSSAQPTGGRSDPFSL